MVEDVKNVIIAVLATAIITVISFSKFVGDNYCDVKGSASTGLYVDYKGVVYKLTPPAAEQVEPAQTSKNTAMAK